jgi:hypothetical protein
MSKNADPEKSDYGKQTLKLSGFFSEWSECPEEEVPNDTVEAAKQSDQE